MIWLALIVALFLLIAFPKQMLAIAGISAVAILLLYLMIASSDQRRRKEREAVAISVRFDTATCSPDFPLHVTITNGSSKMLTKVSWHFAAYHRGFSSNVADYSKVTSDKILARGESYSVCYRAPRIGDGGKPDQLEWKAEGSWPDFAER